MFKEERGKMNKLVIAGVAVLMVALAGTYFYFSGKEYVVRITEAQIQEKLKAKLPLTKTYFFIIQVTLNNPRISLENGSSRVVAGMDVIFNITLNKNPESIGGTVDASGEVTYVSESGQFFLVNPEIKNLEIQGVPQKYLQKVNKALTKALVEYYKDHPIYTLSLANAKQAAAKIVLKSVIVEKKELVVTLGI